MPNDIPRAMRPYIESGGLIGPYLKHPLIFAPLTIVQFEGGWPRVLDAIEHKRTSIEGCLNKGQYHTAIFLHERPYRADALYEYWQDHDLAPDVIGPLAASVWVDSENINQNLDVWSALFSTLPGRCWMDDEEESTLAMLPDTFTVYRGVCEDGGYSWTLSRKIAQFFADRGIHNSTGEVRERVINREDAYAYLGGRNESEILIVEAIDC